MAGRIGLDVEYAQQLCDILARELGSVVSFMGEGGRIIASSARERLGDYHEIAGRVMAGEIDEREVTKLQAMRSRGMREGYNVAIEFDGQRVANLGVAAPVEVAKRHARLAKFFALSLMEARKAEQERQAERAAERERWGADIREIGEEVDRGIRAIAEEIAVAGDRLGTVSEELGGAIATLGDQTKRAQEASESARTNIERAEASSNALQLAAQEIARQVEQASGVGERAEADIDQASTTIWDLGEASTQIGGVVKLINDIAGQTNLLALNATIEAARAGEAGKGFAVVAQEVKNLASQTAKATEEVSRQIEHLQQRISEATDAVQRLRSPIEALSSVTATVMEGVARQRVATEEIAGAVRVASEGSSGASKAVGAARDESARFAQTAGNISTISGDLASRVRELTAHVDSLRKRLRA